MYSTPSEANGSDSNIKNYSVWVIHSCISASNSGSLGKHHRSEMTHRQHCATFAAFIHSMQNVPVARQERLTSTRGEHQEKYWCRKGQEGEILFLPRSQGPDSEETSRRKAKEKVRGSLNWMRFPSFPLENGFQSCQAQQGWETLLRPKSDTDQGCKHWSQEKYPRRNLESSKF